ncbi:LMBR1-like membrane protein domain-containing protein [Phthorimaea operculella]|nr:LMBR1-like membrane protein domain-containing protein [Phthorimaea operculella]
MIEAAEYSNGSACARSFEHDLCEPERMPREHLPRQWWWECFLKLYFLKLMAVVTGILSVMVVWSEMTFFCKKPVLSIFANIINAAKWNYNYAAIVTLSTLIIAYMFYCAYSTLLKIRLLNLYYLAPHHMTNEYSLIFSGMMVSRLTPAMCLNFLSLVHMDSHVIKERVMETYYTQVMGHMDVLGIIAEGFNIYFPMLVVLLCAATYLSLGSRLLSMCGFHQFVGDDELTTDLVDEGREIVKREKRKRQRQEETMTRRRDFSERYATYRSNRERDTGNADGARTGLLNDVDSDYYVQPSPERRQPVSSYQRAELPYNRTLEDDLDQRFGESTLPSIRTEFEGNRKMTVPPKGLFDDV